MISRKHATIFETRTELQSGSSLGPRERAHDFKNLPISFCIPPLETLKFLLLIESEDAGFLEGSLQFAEAAELLLAAAGC